MDVKINKTKFEMFEIGAKILAEEVDNRWGIMLGDEIRISVN